MTDHSLSARLLTAANNCAVRAQVERPDDVGAFFMGNECVGYISPDTRAVLLCEPRFAKHFHFSETQTRLLDEKMDVLERSELLAQIAHYLRTFNLVHAWRGELLDVRAEPSGPVLARMERAVFRNFGCITHGVHLNCTTPLSLGTQGLWAAQRSAHKTIAPLYWDNIAAGLVSSGETAAEAMSRETMEEAGLDFNTMDVCACGSFLVERPVKGGWMREITQNYLAQLSSGVIPHNQDGEVAQHQLLTFDEILSRIEKRRITLEASMSFLSALAFITATSLPKPFATT